MILWVRNVDNSLSPFHVPLSLGGDGEKKSSGKKWSPPVKFFRPILFDLFPVFNERKASQNAREKRSRNFNEECFFRPRPSKQ